MKRFLIASTATIALCTSAFALDEAKEFNNFLKTMATRVNKAFNTKNVGFFNSIMTADFTERAANRTSTRAQSLAGLKAAFSSAKTIKATFRPVSTKMADGNGIATTTGRVVMNMKPTKADPKSHVVEMQIWQNETWIRAGKTWKLRRIEEAKPAKMKMDGKPFDPANFAPGGG